MQADHEKVDKEIRELTNTVVEVVGNFVKVGYELILSMIDGKVCNALTETTSTRRCYLWGFTSKEFNDIDQMLTKDVNI